MTQSQRATTPAPVRVMLIALSEAVAGSLREVGAGAVEVTVSARPAESVRRFDQESPDAVLLGVGADPEQASLLLQALRDRPLGVLVPVLLLDLGESSNHALTTPEGAAKAGADRYLPPNTPPHLILRAMGELLGVSLRLVGLSSDPRGERVELDSAEAPTRRQRPPFAPTVEREPAVPPPSYPNIEPPSRPAGQRPSVGRFEAERELDPTLAPAESRPQPYAPQTLRTPSTPPPPRYMQQRKPPTQEVTAEVIRLKLRQVRHEDYFSILDLRKSAELHQVEQSYHGLRRRFEPVHVPAPLADRHHAELREICDALEDAFAVLSDPGVRDAYLRALLQIPDHM